MDIQALKGKIPTSPAFVIDETALNKALAALTKLRLASGCKLLYSIKSLPLVALMELIKPYVNGFSVSSLFEARLASEVLAEHGEIHLTTPGIRPDEINELVSLCSHISANSLSQFQRLISAASNQTAIGLRINPKMSFTDDTRHDPCRIYSKLGVELEKLIESNDYNKVKGLHFHTVYSALAYQPLLLTIDKLREILGDRLADLDWLNLGGGYLFDQIDKTECFVETVVQLKNDYGLEVIIEPGNSIIGKAGFLLATVIDCFSSDGKTITVLDTSVNHLPQVFEYQQQPALAEHVPEGNYSALLVGSTCLAGDLFGEYRFNKPPAIGDRLLFMGVGAYSLAKANRFNGYNLPDVYKVVNDQALLLKHNGYQDYRRQWVE